MLLRKAKLSSIAMGIGWVACNLTLWIVCAIYAAFTSAFRSAHIVSAAWVLGIYAIASGIVIAAVWLLIFLPVDLIVSDASLLRKPATAWVAGLASAFAFTIIHLGTVLAFNASFDFMEVMLFELLLTGVTGSIAAYARCRLKPHPTSNNP
jgi:hypothetical protein